MQTRGTARCGAPTAAASRREAPCDASEHQRDTRLHRDQEERVVGRAGVTGGGNVTADVEPVRQAAPGELGDEHEQRKRKIAEKPLVPPCPLHNSSVPPAEAAGQRFPSREV
jgi:hypothetical protein